MFKLKLFVQISTTIWSSFNRSKYLNLIVIWTRFNQLEVTFQLPFDKGFINQKSSQTCFNLVMLAVVHTPFRTYNLTLKEEKMIILYIISLLYTQKSWSNLVNNSFITYYENDLQISTITTIYSIFKSGGQIEGYSKIKF